MGLIWFGKKKKLEYRINEERLLHLENTSNFWMLKYEIVHKELVRVNRACERLSRKCKRLRKQNG